jgi:hypothetical protein
MRITNKLLMYSLVLAALFYRQLNRIGGPTRVGTLECNDDARWLLAHAAHFVGAKNESNPP